MGFDFETAKTIEICGKAYECDPGNPDIMLGAANDFQEIIRLSNEMEEMQKRFLADDNNQDAWAITGQAVRKNTELTEACRRMIQGCLGEDEYNEIFSSRRPNSTEHLKLCTYLFEYLIAGRDKVVEEYLDLPEEAKKDVADHPAAEDP